MSFKKKDVLKIAILGSNGVGKKSLIQQFVQRKWSSDARFDSMDIPRKVIAVEEKQVTLELYPVDSLDSLTSLLNGASCDGCLLAYDISTKASFTALQSIITHFLQHPHIASQMTPPPIIIVGNKFDLNATKRGVPKEEAQAWASSLASTLQQSSAPIPHLSALPSAFEFYEVSAKTADNIDTVFYRIARLSLNLNHNMLAGAISQGQNFNQMQHRLCLVDGCHQPRTFRGYCQLHSNSLQSSQTMVMKSEDVILPTLFQLNKDISKHGAVRSSPYHLALLGAIRQLIITITNDKERTFQLYPAAENDIYKTANQARSPKSDRSSIVALDTTRPLMLPKILYNSILEINRTQADLLTIVNPPKDNKKAKDDKSGERVVSTTIPVDQFSGEFAPQRNKLPILDITVSSNLKNLPPHYTSLQKSWTGRRADLNSGSGGKDVFICYLRDTPGDAEASPDQMLLDDPNSEQRWNVYANGVHRPIESTMIQSPDCNDVIIEGSCLSEELLKRAHAALQLQQQQLAAAAAASKKSAPAPKKKGKPKPEIKLNLLAQLLPVTAVNLALLLPRQREDAPFGFELCSNMPDSTLANLNAGTQSDTQIYFALHRAAPGPDYILYARDLFGEGEIDKNYTETAGGSIGASGHAAFQSQATRGSFVGNESLLGRDSNSGNHSSHALDFNAIVRTQSMLSQPLIAASSSTNTPGQVLTANDIYTLSKTPLTILTEDSRSMTRNYPLGGPRGCGAPIIDIAVIFPQRGESCPIDWHELNVTLLHHHAMLNTGTDGNEIKFCYKLDIEPVLNKVYRPFLEVLTQRSNEANILGVDNNILLQFTQFCAILTVSLYSPNVQIVLDAINCIRQLIKPSPPQTQSPDLTAQDSSNTSADPEKQPNDSPAPTRPTPPPPPPAVSKQSNIVHVIPPQIFNAFIHTICDAAPHLLGILYNKERSLLLELLEIIVDKTSSVLSSYTVMRIVDIFTLFRSTDMYVADESPLINALDDLQANGGSQFLQHTYASSYVLRNSLRVLKPIVTAANMSQLKHQNQHMLSPMIRLDPSGSYPRLVDLILRGHVFDDGQVLLGRGKKDGSSGGLASNAPATPLLTRQAKPHDTPLAAPEPPPTIVSHLNEVDPDTNTPSFHNNTSIVSPGLSSKKISQTEIVQRSRTQEEIGTIVNNINSNPYDMCASLMRYLADQVVSSKITDQEIGRLQRRPYGSQPLADLACITDRLITDHHSQRNWLLDPPVGYSVNPTLRVKRALPANSTPQFSATSPLLGASGPGAISSMSLNPRPSQSASPNDYSSPAALGLPTFESLSTPSHSDASPNTPYLDSLPTINHLASLTEADTPRAGDAGSKTFSKPPPSPTIPNASSLSSLLQSRAKSLTVDVNTPETPNAHNGTASRNFLTNQPQKGQSSFTTYTRVFHDPDLNPDGTPYQWKYFQLQFIRNETEAERRKRRKEERKNKEVTEALQDAMMLEEHRQELSSRRVIVHNSQHLWSQNLILYKSERTLLSLIIYLCKLACSDSDTNALHASSVKALVNINILAFASIGQAYKAVSPYSLMAKEEMILRRVYALQLLHYILDKSDEFLKSNQASINVIRRYIVPAIINNTVTLVPSMFFISLRCFVILCEKYNGECQAEIGLMLNDVFLELLISSAAPVDFKVHIFELLELILNTPTKIINLYQTQDNSGQRNVYEKLLQTISIIILQTQYSKNDIGNVSTFSPEDTRPLDLGRSSDGTVSKQQSGSTDIGDGSKRVEQSVPHYHTSSDARKSVVDIAAERLRKCALRLLMHHLHMLAQWVGVPSLKRSLDATNALKLTCKSYLHVLICSETFPELLTTTPDYSTAIKIAAKKLQMYFESFQHAASTRPYVQMPGILEELLRTESEKSLKQLLGLNSGLTRAGGTTFRKELLQDLVPKEQTLKDNTNLRSIARQVMIDFTKTGLAASSQITIQQANQQHKETIASVVHQNSVLGNISHNSNDRASGPPNSSMVSGATTPSASRHQRPSKLIANPTGPTSPVTPKSSISGAAGQPPTPQNRGSIHLGVAMGKTSADIARLQDQQQSGQHNNQEDFDMDGGYLEITAPDALTGQPNVSSLQKTFEKIGDEVCVSVQKILGDIPGSVDGLELGLDLGHYTSMDPYTISMVKNNPTFATTLTSRSSLSKQRQEYLRVYKEASQLAKGKQTLKEMLKFLHTKYPRWLTPYNIAQLLYQNPYISPDVVGDYISNQDDNYFTSDQFTQLRVAYTNLIDISGMPFTSALRYYLTNGGFRMPGEGQKIDRLVTSFCQAFTRDNPDEFANVDIAAIVCFATILLNTELHNPSSQLIAKKNAKPPMTLPQFINNVLSAGAAGKRTDILCLVNIYIEISGHAIEWIGDDTNHDHFDTALILEQLLETAATGGTVSNPNAGKPGSGIGNDTSNVSSAVNSAGSKDGLDEPNPGDLTAQAVALFNMREAIKSQSKLRLLRRRALCDVRAIGPLSQRNDATSSTQIMSILWSHVWHLYLRSVASKMDSSPFFSPQSLRGGNHGQSNQTSQIASGLENLKIDEVDYETLHMCIDSLAYGCAVSIALGNHDARKPFMRSLAKIVFLETQGSKLYSQQSDNPDDKDAKGRKAEDELLAQSHVLSPQLQTQLLSGEHYKQPWYTNLESLSVHSPVLACKMLLSIASNTKTNISFQRRQQILRIMEREFGGRESINLSADTDRSFIRKSKLIKLSSSNKKQAYTFFLFNDLLIYADEESTDKYRIHQVLHLSLLRIVSLLHETRPLEEKRQEILQKVASLREQLANNNNIPNSTHNHQIQQQNAAIMGELSKIVIPPQPPARFKIISPQKSFVVECANEAEMTTWITLIQDCITKLLVKRSDWCIRAKDAISAGVLHPDLIAAKKLTIDTKKNRVDNKEELIVSIMDAKGNIPSMTNFYVFDPTEQQKYLTSVPKGTYPVPIQRSLQLKKYSLFSGAPAYKLIKLAAEGYNPSNSNFCKLCLRPYAFRRSMKTCQHCGEDVCADCCKSIDVLIQPMVKVRSIRACHSCVGFLPPPTSEDGRALIGDNQPILSIGDEDDGMM